MDYIVKIHAFIVAHEEVRGILYSVAAYLIVRLFPTKNKETLLSYLSKGIIILDKVITVFLNKAKVPDLEIKKDEEGKNKVVNANKK